MRHRMTPTPPLSSLRPIPGDLRCWTNHRPWPVAVELDAYERRNNDAALRFFVRSRCSMGTARGWGATLEQAHANCAADRRRLLLAALCDRVAS